LHISTDEYRRRLAALQGSIRRADLDLFIVSAYDSIYYLTGAGFEPFERPFFLMVPAQGVPFLLAPKLEQEHMKKAQGIAEENITVYWEYPAPAGRVGRIAFGTSSGAAGPLASSPHCVRRSSASFTIGRFE
jgi:Xaa-Pro aminopeptidase